MKEMMLNKINEIIKRQSMSEWDPIINEFESEKRNLMLNGNSLGAMNDEDVIYKFTVFSVVDYTNKPFVCIILGNHQSGQFNFMIIPTFSLEKVMNEIVELVVYLFPFSEDKREITKKIVLDFLKALEKFKKNERDHIGPYPEY
ncbi:hypothetical protein [Cytobacillus firmus]|uniref:Uncharacterized protein n=1 Tax=Cytobacillus firmus DS1 TaxID=1307436 RepID=W7L2G6_CYTFI|nr:hypothetical protein [Cytobacillus firmus]EWG09307.1 hypothetical protein PBF_20078 [Cytobacillus firmus DS1]